MVNLNIKIINESVRRYYDTSKGWSHVRKLKPEGYKGDAGFDLYFPEQILICAYETALIPLGIAGEMTDEYVPISYYVTPRSSIYKTPLRMSNSIGVMDSGYRGEYMVPVDNNSEEDYMIKPGERLFQVIHPLLIPFTTKIVDRLSKSERGEGGFGSTGKWVMKH